MDIFKRLYDVTRANVNRRLNNSKPSGATYQQQPDQYAGFTESPPQNHTPPGQDPVLAGYYAALEVPYGSDLETVRKAWKTLMRKYHPDLHGQDAEKQKVARELTQGLNEAYSALEKHLS